MINYLAFAVWRKIYPKKPEIDQYPFVRANRVGEVYYYYYYFIDLLIFFFFFFLGGGGEYIHISK